jgi:hypothetical protein
MASDCIEWTGAKNEHGYGQAGARRWGTRLAHRQEWIKANGAIPSGLCVLHRCDNRACINVEHLFLGTQTENLQDMTSKGRRRNGVKPRPGEMNPMAKLTVSEVLAIRASEERQQTLADRYGISQPTVSDIKHGRRWAWLR